MKMLSIFASMDLLRALHCEDLRSIMKRRVLVGVNAIAHVDVWCSLWPGMSLS